MLTVCGHCSSPFIPSLHSPPHELTPRVSIRHVMRKRYVHLSGGQLTTDEDVPWGSDSLITIHVFEDGKYAFQADNGRFLSYTSELKEAVDDSCKFAIEFAKGDIGKVCFKASNNSTFFSKEFIFSIPFKPQTPQPSSPSPPLLTLANTTEYLTPSGATGLLKTAREEATRDEQFMLEDSQPQIKLKNIKFGKFASIKGSLEVQCNQTATTDTECFQMEINPATKQVAHPLHLSIGNITPRSLSEFLFPPHL
jgi:hypothetical protein